MKPNLLLCIPAALAGLVLCNCVGPVDTHYAAPATVSTDFVLTYGNGWSGAGYYYGPPGLSYYHRVPGVYYYHTRDVVPAHYWDRWHGDMRYYGGPARRHDRREDRRDYRYDRRDDRYERRYERRY